MKNRLMVGKVVLCGVITSLFTVLSTATIAAGVSGQGTWESMLQGRDLDGDLNTFEAYYDTVQNITWLVDANFAMTSGYDADGAMDWATANSWVAGLNIGGVTGWRLPTWTNSGRDGCDYAISGTDCGYNVDTSTGELASMFYDTLGNLAYVDTAGNHPQPGWGLTNSGPFINLQSGYYWLATEYLYPGSIYAWYFSMNFGVQNANSKSYSYYAWAVHSGDVGTPLITSASEGLSVLINLVMEKNLQAGISNALDSKLSNALSAVDDNHENNDGAALNMMYAFCNSAEAQRGSKLTDVQTGELIASANTVIKLLDEYAPLCE